MFKRLVILPVAVIAASCASLAIAPFKAEERAASPRDAIQWVSLPTTTSTTTTVAATTTTTTTIPSGDWRCPQWLGLALEVGWAAEQLQKLDSVMYRESRCNYDSHNPSDPMTGSYGLMQVNGFWCSSTKYNPEGWLQTKNILYTCDDLMDPATNLRAALAIWQRSGWSPW